MQAADATRVEEGFSIELFEKEWRTRLLAKRKIPSKVASSCGVGTGTSCVLASGEENQVRCVAVSGVDGVKWRFRVAALETGNSRRNDNRQYWYRGTAVTLYLRHM